MVRTVLQFVLWSLLYGMERICAPLTGIERLRRRSGDGRLRHRVHQPDGAAAPPGRAFARRGETDTPKEETVMNMDQDLSGNMVKVVQYTIVSVATGADDTARVLTDPKQIAFADDMTAADFTSWILSMPENKREIAKTIERHYRRLCLHRTGDELCKRLRGPELAAYQGSDFIRLLKDPKFHRVAFFVMSRFAQADIDWEQEQARYLSDIAEELRKKKRPPLAAEAPVEDDA